MSTSYYYPSYPFTKIKTRVEGKRSKIELWVSGAYAGEITVPTDLLSDAVLAISSGRCPVRTYWDGSRKRVVDELVQGLDPNLTLISQYGEVLTVEQIRALAWEWKQAKTQD